MKKRLLALALCLVLMTSLLPLTAAAEGTDTGSVHVTGNGFVQNGSGVYILDGDSFTVQINGTDVNYCSCVSKILYQDVDLTAPVTNDPTDGGTYYLNYQLYFKHPDYTDEQNTVARDNLEKALGHPRLVL